ncbi:hypothetical protein B4N84_08395 [Flavobacterium sp. IR1]|nr:hypothetical protein B4N84_08395 [Flavobacterium sp. IR1]
MNILKKYINPEDLPNILDEKTITILAKMSNEIPQSKEWHKIFDLLSYENIRKVMNRTIEIQNLEAEKRKSQMTIEERLDDEEKKQTLLKKLEEDPHYFYGNMSQPDTPEEFKSKFGVWPNGTNGENYNPNK